MTAKPKWTGETIREAVGVFADARSLEAAVDDLEAGGFDRSEISLLASQRAVEEKLGTIYFKVADLEDDPKVPRAAYVSNESIVEAEGALAGGLMYVGAVATAGAVVASGGGLAAAIIATTLIGGAGGLIGSLLSKLIEDHHAKYIEDQLVNGGLLLWVRTTDEDREERARAILSKHSAADVHVHDLPVPAEPTPT